MGRPREIDDATIFQATFRALCRLGYARLSLAAVAAEAGASPALLVKRYGSKRDLLLAFFAASNELSRAQFGATRQQHASPIDSLLARYLLRLAFVSDPISQANLLSFYTATAGDTDFAALGTARVQMQVAEIEQHLAEAVARSELLPCDLPRVSRVLLAAINGTFALWEVDPSRSPHDRVREVFDVVLGPLRVAVASHADSEG